MFESLLSAWVRWVVGRAKSCIVAIAILTLVLGWVAYDRFRINSDLSTLITQAADWRQDFDTFEREFPDLVRTAVIVVSGRSVHNIEVATHSIVEKLRSEPEYFSAVAAPGSERFFRDRALLYMSLDELDDMSDRLAQAQPWLTAVSQDPSLRSMLDLVDTALRNDAPAGFANILHLLGDSAARAADSEQASVSWTDELFPLTKPRYQLIYLKPGVGEDKLTDAQVVSEIRRVLSEVEVPAGLEVWLTGEIPLQHEEIEAAVSGVSMAGWLALVLLLLVLVVGVRSAKIIVATFVMLGIGIVWTSAYAMLTVGEYNTLSVVFIVMFFGLGVDFALHYSLRYQEAINRGDGEVTSALVASTDSVGRAISLCTVTTALGFIGFWPTDYQGLADLGIISAGGMFVAWFLTFTFLPAFYALSGAPRAHQMDLPTSDRIVHWLISRRSWVIATVVVAGVAATAIATQSRFDYSVLALKDPQSESMRTLRVLQREGLATDYQLVVVSDSSVDKERLESLHVVDEVRLFEDIVPQHQQDKLFVIADLQAMLWSDVVAPNQVDAPSVGELRDAINRVLNSIRYVIDQDTTQISHQTLQQFATGLAAIRVATDKNLMQWQQGVVGNLVEELDWLDRALSVEEITLAQIPQSLHSRFVGRSGAQLSVITPSDDIAQVRALSAFITGVRDIYPNATGRPVIEWGVGSIVTTAFKQALLFAVISIGFVLLVALRSFQSVVLILIPLLLTGVFALCFGVLINWPINMASILVLPLIFGLGVDNGI
ncbi:MAG: MMPL family transporter, partial [Gammaproteobacteria bacterium]|nr:MMPL family transporter [Gammaproteobacteria bacterium]